MRTIRPDEVYNLGAQSHVRVSFDVPEYTADVDALGTLRLLEAIREEGVEAAASTRRRRARCSARCARSPQTEETPFHPRSPYGVRKVFGYWITRNYREAYGMFAVNGILFNHESPRRGPTFVTRKITRAVGAIQRGEQERAHARQPRREARLGLRAATTSRRVADAAAGRARRLRARDRRDALGARVPRRGVRRRRSRLEATTWRSIRATSGRPRSTC